MDSEHEDSFDIPRPAWPCDKGNKARVIAWIVLIFRDITSFRLIVFASTLILTLLTLTIILAIAFALPWLPRFS